MADSVNVIYVNNLQLPKYQSLQEQLNEIVAKNRTVSGKLFVDYMAKTRVWSITWGWLDRATYAQLRTQYDNQFTLGNLIDFSISGPDAVATTKAFLSLPNARNVKFSGQWVKDLTITIEEQNAVS